MIRIRQALYKCNVSHGFPWLHPNVRTHVYPERAGIPRLKGELSLLLRIFRRHRVSAAVTGMFHKRSNVTPRPRRALPDSAGLPPGLYATNMRPYNKTHSSLGKAI